MKRQKNLALSLLFSATLIPSLGYAAPGTLATAPVFLGNNVDPNIMLAIDDSASMDFELLMPTSDGALWWHSWDKSFVGHDSNDQHVAGVINVNKSAWYSSTWKKFTYLFPNGHSSTFNGQRINGDGTNAHFALPPADAYAYARSPDYNRSYFDPRISYRPWPSQGGYSFADALPSAARFDPIQAGAGSLNLTQNFDATHANWNQPHWQFKFYPGMLDENHLPVVGESLRGVVYFPATYFRKAGSTDTTGYSGNSACPTCLAPDGSLMDKYEIKPANYLSAAQYQLAIQNFANWFTYYRKRHLAMRGSLARTFAELRATRVGSFTSNNRITVTMRDMDVEADRQALLKSIYDSSVSALSSSPNRYALRHAGRQLGRTTNSPIPHLCEKNVAVLATDGYADDITPRFVNQNYDNNQNPPYEDSYTGTLADIAYRYNRYIRISNEGQVTPPAACSGPSPDPSLDCNTVLHMNTIALSLGAPGDTIYGKTHSTIAEAYTTGPTWTDPTTHNHPHQLDDLYHASINGRGEMITTDNPSSLSGELQTWQSEVGAHTGTAAAIGFSSYSARSDSLAFISQFNSIAWSGDLVAKGVNRNGSLASQVWSAAQKLDARLDSSPRSIISYNPQSKNGIPFDWVSLSTEQQNDLRTDSSGSIEASDANAQERLLFIAGKRGCEKSSTASCSTTRNLRDRSSRLGDIIHSSAVHVGAPDQNWPQRAPFPEIATYSTYKQDHINREAMVYVGANDGMLHGFSAATGDERFAYIPASLFKSATTNSGLHYLSQPDYQHQYYVDATPTVSDAYFNNRWNTVLVGGLRGGGKGLYALNITDPNQFSSAATGANQVMWEFTHPDLGHSYGQPIIAPVGNASGIEWYVIVSNGYNDEAGGANDGQAQLFMLKLSGPGSDKQWDLGQDYYVLSTGAQSLGMLGVDTKNGLSPAQVVDYNGDKIADRVYAGDLFGNLWAFDIRGSAATWSSRTPLKLFTTNNYQAITAPPNVSFNPNMPSNDATSPNLMVMFGSGQYLVNADRSSNQTQFLYGIWDNGTSSTVSLSQLVEQGPFSSVSTASGTYRIMTAPQPVLYAATSPARGWYISLNETGERVIDSALIHANTVYFVSIAPTSNACDIGGSGWLLALDVASGARTLASVFDVDNDFYVNNADRINVAGADTVVSGRKIEGAIPAGPSKLGSTVYTPDSSANTHTNNIGNGTAESALIRQSWRRLYYDQLN
ncbi:MAG: PilC/PilY family type IV pilus protein [Gammaproteobacteria bacterium]|nr:PilC/PilY family type IV pilus protein [Gammaproteobacteria bacterium]